MDLKQIESFVRVAELGSFTKAAMIMSLPQPLLSRHVRQLEVELRQTLLNRNGRGVTLTEAGQLMLNHGRGILHQVALAKEDLGQVRGALSGRITIGLPPSLTRVLAAPLTLALKTALPQAHISLTEGLSVAVLDGLREGRIDLALIYNPDPSPDFELTNMLEHPLGLIASIQSQAFEPRQTMVNLQRIATLPLILTSRPNTFRLLIDSEMARNNIKPNIALQIDGLNAILELVKEGVGYAVLPAYTLRSGFNSKDYRVLKIVNPELICQITLARSAKRQQTATQKVAETVALKVLNSHQSAIDCSFS